MALETTYKRSSYHSSNNGTSSPETVAAPGADRNARHSDEPLADKVSRITDLVLGGATGLTFYYHPVSTVLGAVFAGIFGDKEVKILSGQPKLASLLTSPYVKAAGTAASILLFSVSTPVAAFSLGCLMCCRLQRTKREPAPTTATATPKPNPQNPKRLY